MTLCLALLFLHPVCGQTNYNNIWRQIEEHVQKDEPKSALKLNDFIIYWAKREKNQAQLLRATLMELQLYDDISPDSAQKRLHDMEALTEQMKGQTDEVRALWLSAVGQLRLKQWNDTASTRIGKEMLRLSVDNLELLHHAKATDYLPLFVKGDDSRYYDNDLLSVLAEPLLRRPAFSLQERREMAGKLCSFYQTHQAREAALLAALDTVSMLQDNGGKLLALQKMKQDYHDLQLNFETYIRLVEATNSSRLDRQVQDSTIVALAREGLSLYGKMPRAKELQRWLTMKENPQATLQLLSHRYLPSRKYSFGLNARHVGRVQLRLVRLDAKADDARLLKGDETFKRIPGRVTNTYQKTLPQLPAWRLHADSIEVEFPKIGVYRLELSADGKAAEQSVVYVSRLYALRLSSSGDTCRVRALDAVSGHPVSQASVRVMKRTSDGYAQQRVVEAHGQGEIILPRDNERGRMLYFLSTPDDAFLPSFGVDYWGTFEVPESAASRSVNLYTDRAIYRPGQDVRFSGIVFTQQGDEVRVNPRYEAAFILRDSNGQEVSRQTCHTDSLGTLSGQFRLPAVCLPGYFSIQGSDGGYISFRVEAYKRPTFTVSLETPQGAYRLGDEVVVKGKAESYTKQPIANAQVKYTIASWQRGFYRNGSASGQNVTGEAVTDSLGCFNVPVRLVAGKENTNEGIWPLQLACFSVEADVTAGNGETASASCQLTAGNKASWLSTDFPTAICRETPKSFSLSHTGSNGQMLSGQVVYRVMQGGQTKTSGKLETGTQRLPENVLTLPSGEYAVTFSMAGVDTLQQHFMIFSENDERPIGSSVLWQYVRTSEQGDSALVVVGSPCDSVKLFYALFTNRRMIEQRVFDFSNRLLRFPLHYNKEWGDGARAVFAFVKNNEIYTVSTTIVRPKPEKRLQLRWSSFRSTLQPGQKETWRLCVTHPDGTPAAASLMARLYDASLDAFEKSTWNLSLDFSRSMPHAYYHGMSNRHLSLYYQKDWKTVYAPSLRFTHWNEQLLNGNMYVDGRVRAQSRNIRLRGKGALTFESAAMAEEGAMLRRNNAVAGDMVFAGAMAELKLAGTNEAADAGNDVSASTATPRANFAETAFFMPSLFTDNDGEVALQFSLPESLTSWNFTALAHTKDMKYGRLDTTVVARKYFMVEPAMPRFVRQGDEVVVPVTVRNLTSKAVDGMLFCEVSNPDTPELKKVMKQKFSLQAASVSTVFFRLKEDGDANVLLCRIVGESKEFSDGEEHLLPVLTNRVVRTRSVPFSTADAGSMSIRLDTLWSAQASGRSLTVEMTTNPTWYAVSALAPLTESTDESATGWAVRYYAAALASHIAGRHPELVRALKDSTAVLSSPLTRNSELRQVLLAETPWAAEAKTEQERMAALQQLLSPQAMAVYSATAIDHLRQLQNADGSWSWYPGMRGNAYITADVALLLARLQAMTAKTDAASMLERAMAYLKLQMAEEISRAKQEKRKVYVGTTQLDYLYVCAQLKKTSDETFRTLLKCAEEQAPSASMDEKALLAVVLQGVGEKQAAGSLRQSLIEHTVATTAMGRYFDTRRARFSSQWYRIPAQTATIEALLASSEKNDKKVADEMRLWLMQSKRTQQWTSSRVSADAVYALLGGSEENNVVMPLSATGRPLTYSLYKGSSLVGFNAPSKARQTSTFGYVCDTYSDDKALQANRLVVRKETPGLSWGAVTAQFTEPLVATQGSGGELTVQRRLEKWADGSWTVLSKNQSLQVGDRVRQVITAKAARDFDFVTIKISHPACFAVRQPLSGYEWQEGGGSYRAVNDASVSRHFDQFAKGSHVVVEEYVVDRAGRYEGGIVSVQSQYAPEFSANTAGLPVVTEESK